ncbi:MAG: adenylate/guanylate cyclase domain-containing protein [Aestuariivita sp.]|uniref:adenylate/guanylate cyclase domain-containing protein n=1 Tax=Aestuariivita sp. TaxID=1872407 RepID=UPI003BB1260A
MADTSGAMPNFTRADLPDRMTEADLETPNRYTEDALERHKREGLDLAIKARWVALAVVAVMLPFLNPTWGILYYHALLGILALNGWLMRRVGRVGASRIELVLIFVDLAVMTFALAIPNPFESNPWPTSVAYEFGNFIYFFIILAGATLAYSWRTIIAIGNWTAILWIGGAGLVWYFGTTIPELTDRARAAFGHDAQLFDLFDPNRLDFDIRIQEVVVFVICAYTLAITVRRFNRLLLGNAVLERERANLSRYFSPNVVDELSRNDDPLKKIRTHNVAVLFVDIVGFTKLASHEHPEKVMGLLRELHQLMETEVFAHSGTLDKYLGDGLMATFGTPFAGERDALNAINCAKAMAQAVDAWNAGRVARGEPEIQASFGVHFGPVVLGDIGVSRLEFAVIGNTVNVASRLESMTRDLGTRVAISDHAHAQALRESGGSDPSLAGFANRGPREVRGLDEPIDVWTIS